MACRLFAAKPLFKPMLVYCHLDPREQTLVKFLFKNIFLFTKKHLKCEMTAKWRPNDGQFVSWEWGGGAVMGGAAVSWMILLAYRGKLVSYTILVLIEIIWLS